MKFIKKYGISILVLIAITVLCFMKTDSLPKVHMTNFDKLVHCVMFFFVSGVIYFENTHYFKKAISYQRIVLGSFLIPIIFSGLTELGQEYITPYRQGDWWDFMYDTLGVFLGFTVCLIINKRLPSEE